MLPPLLARWLPVRKSKPSRRRTLGVERLEDRTMPATGLSQEVVVGRTLSAYTVDRVQNNSLDVTYTIYNQTADDLTGVLLTTTLQPGVAFTTATQLPDRNGQELAWSLGSIPGFGRASITLTVRLPNTAALQIDGGARAFATRNAGTATDTTPAATLVNRPIAPELLASTADANTADPFVQEKAAALDYDPQRIFEYLKNDIGYESYTGSLRGARGTMWSEAGNTLDEASLGVALFRASGIPARYAAGTLTDPQARELILSMFPPSFQTVGFIPPGTPVADPANDPQLLAESRQHYWLQYDPGTGFRNVDGTFATAALGQAFTTATGTFAEVADSLRHKVTVRVNVESFAQASAVFALSSGLSTRTVLDVTLNTAEIVGRPLTFGNFIGVAGIGGPTFSRKTFTYSPFLMIGSDGNSPEDLRRGTDYQESLTNFPASNLLVSGVFLEVDVRSPGRSVQTFDRTIVDRIGFAARRSGSGGNVVVDPNGPPIINNFDLTTLNVVPSEYSISQLTQDYALLREIDQQRQELVRRMGASQSPQEDEFLDTEGTNLTRALLSVTHRAQLGNYAVFADAFTRNVARSGLVKAYFDSPRITIASSNVKQTGPTTARVENRLDLRKDDIRALLPPGQGLEAADAFQLTRGVTNNAAEREALAVLSSPSVGEDAAVNTLRIFEAAAAQGIGTRVVGKGSEDAVAVMAISAEARTRILDAIARDRIVFVPDRSVLVAGESRIGWYELNPTTAELVGVLENGDHGVVESKFGRLVAFQARQELQNDAAFLAGIQTGTFVVLIAQIGRGLLPIPPELSTLVQGFAATRFVAEQIARLRIQAAAFAARFIVGSAFERFVAGLAVAVSGTIANLLSDPPIPTASVIDFRLGGGRPFSGDSEVVPGTRTLTAGPVTGGVATPHLSVSNRVSVAWTSDAVTAARVTQLRAAEAEVFIDGVSLGRGAVTLDVPTGIETAVAGVASYRLSGTGRIAFYAPATTRLGVSGTWDAYTGSVVGSTNIRVSTNVLRLNGAILRPGTVSNFTIVTAAANFTGMGVTAAATFSQSATVTATDAVVSLGSRTGNLTLAGRTLDAAAGVTLGDYDGTLTVVAGAETDTVTFAGTAGRATQLTSSATTVSANQNQSATFDIAVSTTVAETFTLVAEAPDGWTVTVAPTGRVSVTPKPGLQSGTFAVRVTARSQTDGTAIAQLHVPVTVTPTVAGLSLDVVPEPLFTVPAGGTQVPTVFRALFTNRGPVADTFRIATPTLPAGFTAATALSTVRLGPGETAQIGVYLLPSGPLPAPGTVLNFSVSVTSEMNPSITATATETFTVPEIHGVTLTPSQPAFATTPGTAARVALTLAAVGNVAETVQLTAVVPTGLTLFGLDSPVTLARGESQTLNLFLTPNENVPLNSNFSVTFTATFATGELGVQTITIPVRVVAPGADDAGTAAVTAIQLGKFDLANRLNDLATSISNLFQTTDSAVFKSQVLAGLDAVAGLIAADPALSQPAGEILPNLFFPPPVPPPTDARARLVAATTPAAIRAALDEVAFYLGTLRVAILNVARNGFELGLVPTSAVVLPGSVARYEVFLRNTGTDANTYNLRLEPDGLVFQGVLTPTFRRNGAVVTSVTLQPGEAIAAGANGLTLELDSTSRDVTTFAVRVETRSSGLTRFALGTVALRPTSVGVASVTPSPAFTNPGTAVAVTARLVNTFGIARDVRVSYVVRDSAGTIVRPAATTMTTLPAQGTGLIAVTLAPFDTTGLTLGEYTIDVTVTDAAGNPFPAAVPGRGRVRIGTPVAASLTGTPGIAPTGINVRTQNSLTLAAQVALASPFTLIGQAATTPTSNSVAIVGTFAYVAGTDGIDVVDVSNPAAPVVVRTVAQSLIVRGGFTLVRPLPGNRLAVASTVLVNAPQTILLIFDLTDPLNPALVSNTPLSQVTLSDLRVSGNTAILSTFGDVFFAFAESQFGDVAALDLTGTPTITDRLTGTGTAPQFGNSHHFGIELVDTDTGYVASTTLADANFTTGEGRVRVVNFADPANLLLTRDVPVPGTVKLYQIARQGTTALVVGTTGIDVGNISLRTNNGFLTLTTLDLTDPDNPVVVETVVTTARFPQTGIGFNKVAIVPVGGGRFAVSHATIDGQPVILLVDVNNPAVIRTAALTVTADVDEMTFANGQLFATTAAGLLVFDVNTVETIAATASVRVPNNTNVSVDLASFNIAPDRVIPDGEFQLLEWDRQLGAGLATQTFTWTTRIADLQSGDLIDTATGGTVAFTSQGTPGTVALDPTRVAAANIIAISPATRTARPGEAVEYTVTITNPSERNTFDLNVTGLPAEWVSLPTNIDVLANSTATVTLRITPDSTARLADYRFNVAALLPRLFGETTIEGTVGGSLTVASTPVSVPNPNGRGVVLQLTPTTATAGRGTAAAYTVRVTNTGSATATFTLAASGLPANVAIAFDTVNISVPPGIGNFRDVRVVLTPAVGATVGNVPFTITATGTAGETGTANGSLSVVANGVDVALTPGSAVPGATFDAMVTNTGTTTDTFDLVLAGPAGLSATLATSRVTLAAGETRRVAVTTQAVSFAVSGDLQLMVMAQSVGNTAVRDAASAALTIAPSRGLTIRIEPATRNLAGPGTVDFLVFVNNTGNVEEAYTATITGANGPINAVFIGPDGLPLASIDTFRLPGLSSGAFLLRATLTAGGTGTITVNVTTQSTPTLNGQATATVTAPTVPNPPGRGTPTVMLTADRPQAFVGDAITFTATVRGSGATPTGTVTFFDGTTPLQTVALANGTAVAVVRGLAAGAYAITATFNGDAAFLPATGSPVTVTVSPARRGQGQIYALGAGLGGGPRVQVYDAVTDEKRMDFFAYDDSLRGGVTVATGDVTGDGVEDLVTAPGAGGGPHIKVFDGSTGVLLASWFAYEGTFRGGASITTGDVDGDGVDEVVTAPGVGGGPHVKIWRLVNGTDATLIDEFFAFDEASRGGATVVCGVDALGRTVIAAGAGPGEVPRVRTFDAATQALLSDQLVYEEAFTGGVYLAAGDVLGTGRGTQIVVGPGPGGGPRLRLLGTDGGDLGNLFAAPDDLRNGLTVAALDRPSGAAAVLLGAGRGAFRSLLQDAALTAPERLGAFEEAFNGGVFVG